MGAWAGPNFYFGYLGDAWDSDEFAFETRFWSALGPGLGVGQAFDQREARVVQPGVRRQLVRQLRMDGAGRAPADGLHQVSVR